MPENLRRVSIRWIWIPTVAVLLVVSLASCGSQQTSNGPLQSIGECGGIHFPDGVNPLANRREPVSGVDIVEVVADLPDGKVHEFEAKSSLGEFKPGVPNYWRSEYWKYGAVADVLQSDVANKYYEDFDGDRYRWIVIHNLGDGKTRVFVRTSC
ncbi:hypothetical protein [Nocardia sp. BMG51109]|uniref:hypothetical protein n=1 Tax=Nocardia sp. BMG51109 TaxID=1056816 RepID=UPI0004B272FE|nr:hypothetical protein [Nocardia sp. BMG51109]